MGESAVRVEARAKVNVFLRVLGRRGDGYHDIETLVLPVTLSDELTARPATTGVAVEVSGEMASAVPNDERNLVVAAARVMARACRGASGVAFTLAKRIPVAAGLGGGSADAAAALLALNDVWECGLALDRLLELAAEVGSDVPAQLHGGPVLARGRGEVLGPVVVAPAWWVILPLGFPVRTPDAFAWWDEEGSTGLDPSAILEAAREGDLERLGALLFNDLEGPVARRHPEIVEAKLRLLDAGALGAVMSGSGPTVAGLARDEFHARRIANASHGAIVVSGPG